ncbi:MAG: carbohydrate porin [Verrucomicrobiae bacterium]|nr:carbohydrate porin [Verrucomicrobiae bacterium]
MKQMTDAGVMGIAMAALIFGACPLAASEAIVASGAEEAGWMSDRRGEWEDQGISFEGEFIYERSRVFDGGLRRDGSDRHLFTFDVEFDLEKLMGLNGGTIFAQFLHVTRERGGSADAGDIQAYTNIETDRAMDAIYELWYQQELMDGRLRIKLGKVDANSEYNYVDAAGNFANSSAGFSPTIFAFPSYPDPSMSVNVFATLVDRENYTFTLGYGLFDGATAVDEVRLGRRGPSTFFSDGVSDDYFQIFQGELAWDNCGDWLEGRLSLGGWHHNGEFTGFDGSMDDGTHGYFLTVEQRLSRRASGSDDGGVYVFAQYGWADESLSEIAQHFGAGVVTQGTFAGRDDDSAGVYITHADLSDDPAAGFAKDETAIDLFYRCQLCPTFYIQPEIQYIVNPSGDTAVDNALIGGVRFSMSF